MSHAEERERDEALPYRLETFEVEFYESVSGHDVAQHVQDRLLATVKRLAELEKQASDFAMAQIAIDSANTQRDRAEAELAGERAEWQAHSRTIAAERDAIGVQRDESFQKEITLQKFKEYVHKRLDDAGVPADPEPEANAKHGCRIEGRLNVLLDARDTARKGEKGHYESVVQRMFILAMEESDDAAATILELMPLPVSETVKMHADFWKFAQSKLGKYNTTLPTGTRTGKRWTREEKHPAAREHETKRFIGEYTETGLIWRHVELVPD